MDKFILVIIIFFLLVFVWFKIRQNLKVLTPPSFCLTTGGVKTGKSKLSVYLSTGAFKKEHRHWVFLKWISKLFKKDFKREEPLYYTNCLVSFRDIRDYQDPGRKRLFKLKPHNLDKCIRQITLESLLREERYNYRSIIYINEASLLADNMDVNNIDRNVKKLYSSFKTKFIIFFIITFIFLFAFWYYITCFCGIYTNTQIHLIKDSVISFGTSFVYPFITYLLPGIFRIPSLKSKKKNKKCMFGFSKFLTFL